jgi:polar amino acid transport system substrate-binding protein
MLRSILGLMLAALVLLPGGVASASKGSEVLSRIVKKGQMRVGMSGSQPPYNFKNKDGQLRGFEVDLAEALGAAMGIEVELVEMPFGELLGALEAGTLDLVMSGMTITLERNLKAAFVGPYQLTGRSILTRSSALARADEAADLNDASVTLAVLAGSVSQQFAEFRLPSSKLVTTRDYSEALKLLRADKVHAVVADYELCNITVALNPRDGFAALSAPLSIEPVGIAVSPGDSLFLNLVQNYLSAIETSGALDLLRARWFDEIDWAAELP